MSTFFCTGCCACKPAECECNSVQYEAVHQKYQDFQPKSDSRGCTAICDKELVYSSDDCGNCQSNTEQKNDYSLYKSSHDNFETCFKECGRDRSPSICKEPENISCSSSDDQSTCEKTCPRIRTSNIRRSAPSYSNRSSCKDMKKALQSSSSKSAAVTACLKRSPQNVKMCEEVRKGPSCLKQPSTATPKSSAPETSCADSNSTRFDIKLPECLENLPEYLEKLLAPKRTCPSAKTLEKTMSEPKECVRKETSECTVPAGEVKSVTICLNRPWTDRPKSPSCGSKFSGDKRSVKSSSNKQRISKSSVCKSNNYAMRSPGCEHEPDTKDPCCNQPETISNKCDRTPSGKNTSQCSSEHQPCDQDITSEICESTDPFKPEKKSCSVQMSPDSNAENKKPECPCHSQECSTGSLEKQIESKTKVCEAETTTSYVGSMYEYLEKETQNLCNNIKRDLGIKFSKFLILFKLFFFHYIHYRHNN